MPKRETEEEMLAKVIKMQGAGEEEDENAGKKEKEEEGVLLEPVDAGVVPRADQETGLKSEKDVKVDTDIIDADKSVETAVKPVVPEDKNVEDSLTVVNAKKRIQDAQTKMHTATSSEAESKKLLEEATLKIQSYETIIARSGTNSTEGIVAQQKIDETSNEAIAGLQSLEEEYPEIAKPLMVAFTKMQSQLDNMELKQVASVDAAEEAGEKVLSTMHYSRISEFYPNYATINKSPEFKVWVDGLSPFERSAALMVQKSGNADESISMLDKFTDDTGYGNGKETTDTNVDVDGNVNNTGKDKIDNDKIENDNLIKAQGKTNPTFTKKKVLKLTNTGNDVQLTVAEIRKMAPTKENEDRILQAMATGNLV